MPTPLLPSTRREFLRLSTKGIGLLAFSQFAPSFLVQSTLGAAPAPEKDRTILVLVQLAGGNDGLNTVIPFDDPNYHALRPTLALRKENVLPVNDTLGLHPGCAPLHALMQEGKFGIIQNVGYPNPNRSHFRSAEIWETASASNEYLSTGWIGRYLDNTCAGAPGERESDPFAVHVSNEVPQAFNSTGAHPTFGLNLAGGGGGGRGRRGAQDASRLLERLVAESGHSHGADDHDHGNNTFLKATMMDALVTEKKVQRILGAYRPEARYPGGGFPQSLRNVAALISAGLSTRVYFVSLGGFDTHANQLNAHQNLLRTLSEGLAAFQQDLEARGLDEQVLTMTFSEFGRRPAENESKGTDHGTAAPLFVLGSKLNGTLHGTAPSLDIDRRADLTYSTDFRQVYSSVLDNWLGCPAREILGADYPPLGFI